MRSIVVVGLSAPELRRNLDSALDGAPMVTEIQVMHSGWESFEAMRPNAEDAVLYRDALRSMARRLDQIADRLLPEPKVEHRPPRL